METNKILALLGFAVKSGNVSFGMNSSVSSIKKKKSNLILAACDISDKSYKELCFFGEKFSVDVIKLIETDSFTLSRAVGKKCGIVSVNNRSFADSIIALGGNAND